MFSLARRHGVGAVRQATSAVCARFVQTEAKLEELGVTLPTPSTPKGNYVPCVQCGDLLYLAGHLPLKEDGSCVQGKVGKDMSTEAGYDASRLIATHMMSTVKAHVGDLDKVKRIVKLTAFVNCAEGFSGQPSVVNGASDLLAKAFGERGIHSRSAVGVKALPLNAPVEIEAIVQVEEE